MISSNPTVKEWLYEWFEVYSIPNVKQSTAISYEGYIRNHLVPELGDIKLKDLRYDILQKYFNVKAQKLSAKTVRNIRTMLHKVFKDAMLNDLIEKNYAEHIRLPAVYQPEMRVLTISEQKLLIAELDRSEEQFAIGIYLCLMTGIRIGELCGLQWKHIDIISATLRIRQTLQRLPKLNYDGTGNKTEIVIGSPKSMDSMRDIPLDDIVIDKIMQYKRMKINAAGISSVASEEYIISSKSGNPIEPRTMKDVFDRILRQAKIDKANLHALRHTFATRALEAGIDFKTLSIILGHSDISVTMNRYAHVMREPKIAAMKSITASIYGFNQQHQDNDVPI